MELFIDQLQSEIRLDRVPRRIVSLVPSQTELLYDLGLEDEVVGITKFCIHPNKWFSSKDRIGGTKSINIDQVKSLAPDLIIGNKEENTIEDIERLREIAPVWMSDIYSLKDALNMIKELSIITGRAVCGNQIIDKIDRGFSLLSKYREQTERKTVLYYIWKDPYMVSGRSTFVDAMLNECGFQNATNLDRYPEIGRLENNPDFIFLSSEPFPFKSSHIADFQLRFPSSKVVLVDGEMFSWYGSRLQFAPDYFLQLLNQIA